MSLLEKFKLLADMAYDLAAIPAMVLVVYRLCQIVELQRQRNDHIRGEKR